MSFFEKNNIITAFTEYNTLKHRIKSNINWIKKGSNHLISWMDKFDENHMDYRLPLNLKPTLYQLEIQVCRHAIFMTKKFANHSNNAFT